MCSLSTVLFGFTHYISVQAGELIFYLCLHNGSYYEFLYLVVSFFTYNITPEIWYLGILCYVLGVYFCYIATEKYEVSFDVD